MLKSDLLRFKSFYRVARGDLIILTSLSYLVNNFFEKVLKIFNSVIRSKKPLYSSGFLQRRGWDSNPCAREDKRFSRPPRYDHFGTSPSYLINCFVNSSFIISCILWFVNTFSEKILKFLNLLLLSL